MVMSKGSGQTWSILALLLAEQPCASYLSSLSLNVSCKIGVMLSTPPGCCEDEITFVKSFIQWGTWRRLALNGAVITERETESSR